jgi:hypothetical protein
LIKSLTTSKNLDVTYIKIRGHSGNFWNDKADEIAKKAIYEASLDATNIIEFNLDFLGWDFNFIVNWNGCTIDNNIKQFNRFVEKSLMDFQ